MFFYFYRESNDFSDILNDKVLKKNLRVKIKLQYYLFVDILDSKEELQSYIMLKYGDDIVKLTENDYSPIPYKDYIPKRKI
jgi:hypothetical protein